MITRRILLWGGALAAGAVAARRWFSGPDEGALAAEKTFPLSLSESEWRKKLTPQQFTVLRKSGTEVPFTSPLLGEHREGTFTCAGCEQAVFSSDTKFDSHTGWPSFWAPLGEGVGEETDRSFGMARTAVHCSRCGGHLGHVFNDGPKPTGLRYCMNGVAMAFRPAAA